MHAYLETLTGQVFLHIFRQVRRGLFGGIDDRCRLDLHLVQHPDHGLLVAGRVVDAEKGFIAALHQTVIDRSEAHTSELQSLMRISYAVFCLKKNTYYISSFSC